MGGTWTHQFAGPGGATAPINNAFPFAADWTLVPEPATLPLVGLAFAMLGTSVRRARIAAGGSV